MLSREGSGDKFWVLVEGDLQVNKVSTVMTREEQGKIFSVVLERVDRLGMDKVINVRASEPWEAKEKARDQAGDDYKVKHLRDF
jgi:hypothetical protein